MLVDTHSHLNFSDFDKDRDEVIKECLKNNVWVINVGTNFPTSKKAVEIAEKYGKGVYAAVGLHPINIKKSPSKIFPLLSQVFPENLGGQETQKLENILENDFDYDKYKNLVQSKKAVAIGEIGLDYYYKPKTKKKLEIFKEKQRNVLCQQLKLAKELNLPVIFHCRFAHGDLINILNTTIKQYGDITISGVIHCFTGDLEQIKKYLEMGFYIGCNGIIFKKIEGINFEEIIKETPVDRILIETDCPYLVPPNFKEERNSPLGVEFVARKIAELKKMSFEEITKITTENARKLFGI